MSSQFDDRVLVGQLVGQVRSPQWCAEAGDLERVVVPLGRGQQPWTARDDDADLVDHVGVPVELGSKPVDRGAFCLGRFAVQNDLEIEI